MSRAEASRRAAAIRRYATLLGLLPLLSGAADYVGAEACARCHPAEFQKQTASHHAHSLRPIEGSKVGEVLLTSGQSPDGRLRYQRDGKHILVSEQGAPERVILEWAFGAGAQGSTPVGLLGGQYLEHRFSYYSRVEGLAPTFGHPPRVSTPLAEFGILQDKRTIRNCFNCHATGLERTGIELNVNTLLPGVQCERCHGPASAHIEAAEHTASEQEIRKQIVNPGRFPPAAQITICGQCHRLPMPGMGEEPELEDPVTVRFAPIGLMASRCFRESKKIACLTCHDPHTDATPRTDAHYTQACLTCHAATLTPIKRCRRVQKENCLPCHMQQSGLKPHLQFTDHRIRIY